MLEKRLAHRLFSKLQRGGLAVTYWDGTTERYGPDEPYIHMTIKSAKVLRDIARSATVGFGEAYMRGDLEIDGPLDEVVRLAEENKAVLRNASKLKSTQALKRFRQNKRAGQQRQIAHHYDIGNDFYKLWLDTSMTYSCAYFRSAADSLEQAQQQKVEHLLRKLQLSKGQTMLDIGSGWGTLALTAAERYGVSVLGITLSKEQLAHSRAEAKRRGLDKLVRFELMNYQDLAETDERFDRIISVGMFEHVGRHNHRQYFEAVDRLLEPGGLSVLHTIVHNHVTVADPWIQKYVFPGGYIPAISEVVGLLPQYNLMLTDFENLRIHYAMTLDEWRRRFDVHRAEVRGMFDEEFCRMWDLYLALSSGSFRYGDLGLGQFVFTKGLINDLPLTREHLYW